MQEIKVFEFSNWFSINKRAILQTHLENVWQTRFFGIIKPMEIDGDENVLKTTYQPFLNFDGEKAKCNNYVGFIQSDELHLEIYPKVFRSLPITQESSHLMLKHLFFWFDYCRKWKLPFSDINLNQDEQLNLPELIINLIANQFYEVLSKQPLSIYTDVEEALTVPRGRINFNRYINENFNLGKQHMLACDHELLLFDNTLNRVIKYVSRFLKSKTKFKETERRLDDIIFLLDEVSDVYCTSKDLDKVNFNSFFNEYNVIKDLCKMVLNQQLYSHDQDEQSHWSLLFPMEYIFEDFVAGFLEQHFSNDWKVEYQKSDMYLTKEGVFQMQHDIFLTSILFPKKRIIIDTKYKMRGLNFKDDNKKGVAQNDLYQMTSYAYRRGCENVLLLYPNENEFISASDTFNITSGFNENNTIKVIAGEIPFWSIKGSEGVPVLLKNKLQKLLNEF
jgi:5-methylcytosine-specific restriction enzyme subunit McrC